MSNEYINISKAFGSSLVEKAGASTAFNSFVPINKIAEIKGLTSNRSLRLAIQKGKYIAREVKVFGGTSYEILYSSLEPEIQEKLQDELIKGATQSKCTALVPHDTKPKYPTFIAESAKLTALARVDVVKALQNIRAKYNTKKEADSVIYADCEQRAENGNGEFSFVDPFNASNQEGDENDEENIY